MDRLVALLQRERLLLELLVFKLVELRQLLQSGQTRFLGWAADEVERAVDTVRDVELERSVVLAELVPDGSHDEQHTLAALIEASDEPVRSVLAEHRRALMVLAGQVDDHVEGARSLAASGSATVTELLDRVAGPTGEPALATYGPDTRLHLSAPAPRVEFTL